MTGFASKTAVLTTGAGNKVNISLSIKSLNSRFFEVTCKVPYALSQLETDFIKLLKSKLHRGHIFLTIHLSNAALFKGTVSPSLATVEGYLKAVDTIKSKFNLTESISMGDLLQLPDVLYMEEKGVDEESKKIIFDLVTHLMDELAVMQSKEGAVLKQDLIERIEVIKAEMDTIEKASALLMEKQKVKISENLKELTGSSPEFSEAQRATLFTMLDKIDIHEEIVRFKNHLKNFAALLDIAKDEKGKVLDFTLQELARENNTIAAKCSDATISTHAINIKVELEKAREQAQNIV
jgi:uncharacterized protein (TIGR00255 family)